MPPRPRLDLAGPQRAGPDEAHVAAQDVPQLRQLVHRGGAHEAADARDARIALDRLDRPDAGFRVRPHRSELERHERRAAEPDALLPEEHRAAVLDLDRRGEQRPERRGGDADLPPTARRRTRVSACGRPRRQHRRLFVQDAQPLAQPPDREFFSRRARCRGAESWRARGIAQATIDPLPPSAPASPAATTRPVR